MIDLKVLISDLVGQIESDLGTRLDGSQSINSVHLRRRHADIERQ
jgi:hypothetical protein